MIAGMGVMCGIVAIMTPHLEKTSGYPVYEQLKKIARANCCFSKNWSAGLSLTEEKSE